MRRNFPAAACLALSFALAIPHHAFAQGSNDPPASAAKLKKVLNDNGFDALQGGFRILDPVSMACVPCVPPLPCAERRDRAEPYIPTTWYNNVEPYMSIILPGRFDDKSYPWEQVKRAIPINYLLRQDEAIVIVGSTPPPMAYYSFQTFLFARYNESSQSYPPPETISRHTRQ